MKVLIITNLYPYREHISSGIFITKRLSCYKKFNVSYKAIAPSFKNTGALIRLSRIILRKKAVHPIEKLYDVTYNPVYINRDFLGILAEKLITKVKKVRQYTESFVEKIADEISEDWDIIHAHGMYLSIPAGMVAMKLSKRLKVPYIVTLHGSDVNFHMADEMLRDVYIEALENASKCIFVSNALLEKAKSYGYSGRNAVVIPNGYDHEIFKPMDKDEVRKGLGIYEEGYKYVGFVGNLIPVKRADKLGEIFRYINQEYPQTRFIVVGEGYLRKDIEKQTKGLEIVFTGMVSQEKVAEYMNAMDVMILPSRNEGFPTVVNEAKACGTCVVGSSNGGIPEAIGFEEYVVKDGDDFEERMADKVVEILRNGYDPERLIKKAANLTWENIVKREVEVYREVIERNDKPLRDEGFTNSSTELRKGE